MEKRTITVTDPITRAESQKEVFVETKVITEEVVRHKDLLESLITQKTNDIENLQIEIAGLQAKKSEIDALSKK